MQAPDLSLVVTTQGRTAELARLLASLEEQGETSIEVILVDQTGPPLCGRHGELLGRTSVARSLHLRSGPTSLSRARNLGLEHAQGRVVGFPDDDCWYPSGTLQRVAAWFGEWSGYDLLLGGYTEPGRSNPRFLVPPCDLTPWRVVTLANSVGLFIRREEFQDLRFAESLGAGTAFPCGEEMDLLLRALSEGRRGRFEPSVVVYHRIERPRSGGMYAWVRANAYVLMRHALRPSLPLMLRAGGGLVGSFIRATRGAGTWEELVAKVHGFRDALHDGRMRGSGIHA
ncbi:MAG: hypothetical protein KatS3mg014_1750 [Actinomycetota bacterium]|nr:MAG: hypothetical protein KatS3mg014_1750 [Actinomycetota bacterium]